MGATITKTFTMSIIFSRDDDETLCIDDINYLQLLAQMKKSIGELSEGSRGIISTHISGEVTVT